MSSRSHPGSSSLTAPRWGTSTSSLLLVFKSVSLPGDAADVDYDKVTGLKDALANPQSSVGTIYNYESVDKTWEMIKGYNADKGEAIFTQPFGPVKCAGGTFRI